MKHGFLFGENIRSEKIKRHRYEEGQSVLKSRGLLLPLVLCVMLVLLISKLFSLQVVHGDEYKKLADSNRTRTLIIHAPRGVIFDRNGLPLVFNIPGFIQIARDKSGKIVKTNHLSRDQALSKIAKGDRMIEVDSLRQYPYKEETSHVLGYIGQISEDELKTVDFSHYQALTCSGVVKR